MGRSPPGRGMRVSGFVAACVVTRSASVLFGLQLRIERGAEPSRRTNCWVFGPRGGPRSQQIISATAPAPCGAIVSPQKLWALSELSGNSMGFVVISPPAEHLVHPLDSEERL